MNSFYDILEVERSASQEEIKKAYRKLSLKHHPDKNGGVDNEMFQKINEAYETLSEPSKREMYDFMGTGMGMGTMDSGTGTGSGSGMNPFMQSGIDEIFQLFAHMAGQGEVGHGPGPGIRIFHMNGNQGQCHGQGQGFSPTFAMHTKPTPIIKTIQITLQQAYSGASIPVELDVWRVERGIKHFEKENIYITIPQGVDDNDVIIERERGNMIHEGFRGDVKIFIQIVNETEFERKGLDLILHKKISLKEALCGFSFVFTHLNNKSYTIGSKFPNNFIVSPNYQKVILSMGLKKAGAGVTGNLIIEFQIEFPKELSQEQIESLINIL
jgi:DnaJ-class molecular chaperone